MLTVDGIGLKLQEACSTSSDSVTVCAPFIKRAPLERLLSRLDSDVALQVVTRWRPDEVAAGISDLSVMDLVTECGGTLRLCHRLHAKYFRLDDRVFIGSANVTGAALGWSRSPNLEMLTEVQDASQQDYVALEERLFAESTEATEEIKDMIERLADEFPSLRVVVDLEDGTAEGSSWLPNLRDPSTLFRAYSTGTVEMSTASAVAAEADLAELDLPPGLRLQQFEACVASRLLQMPQIQRVDDLLADSQRFGAIRDLIAEMYELDRESASVRWQSLMRWLMEFLPERYEYRVANYSEIFTRVTGDSS